MYSFGSNLTPYSVVIFVAIFNAHFLIIGLNVEMINFGQYFDYGRIMC